LADEKKPGLLKRIFSFGFGKKKHAEPEDNLAAEEAARQQAEEEKARLEAERLAVEKAEDERLAREAQGREEQARLDAEAEAKRLEEEKAKEEAEAVLRQAEERAEQERREAQAEAKRLAEEDARQEAEKLEAERLEAEERAVAEKAAGEEEAEKARLAVEKAEAEEAKRLEREAIEKAEREAAVLKETQEKAQVERLAKEQAAAEAERLAEQEAVAKQKAEAEVAEQQARAEAERLEAERLAQEKLEQERLEAERLEQARLEKERLEQARLQAEQEAALKKAQDEEITDEIDEDDDEPELGREPQTDEPEKSEPQEERRVGWFRRLTKGLAKSSSALTENITSVFTKKKLDEETLQDLEDILIQADLGVETAMNITDTLATQRMGKDVTDQEVRQVMADEITKVLEPVAQPLELDLEHQPHVILVVGVNGSGKTTTIGKISQKLYDAGFSTLLVAGDTFRAAAVEQLHIWGDRTQAPVMSRGNGADAAGLAFDAYTQAVEQKKDVMLMDTAGRLQNKKELMDELEKIIRVLKKQDESAPHTVLLTLDATTGQNALNQVEIFKDVAGVNGLVMTKLDGTARGGILVSISAKHKLPIYFIGVGEQVEDLEPFEADVFARAIAGIEEPA